MRLLSWRSLLPPAHYHSVSLSLPPEARTLAPAAWQPLVSLTQLLCCLTHSQQIPHTQTLHTHLSNARANAAANNKATCIFLFIVGQEYYALMKASLAAAAHENLLQRYFWYSTAWFYGVSVIGAVVWGQIELAPPHHSSKDLQMQVT